MPQPHKHKKQPIPKAVRDSVWNYYIGIDKGTSKCLCCDNQQISQNNFECGHVVAEKHKGKATIQNLRPICSLCNKSMQTTNMINFMKEHGYTIKPEFYGRYEMLTQSYPNGYYICSTCGTLQQPSTSWLSYVKSAPCDTCGNNSLIKHSTYGYCVIL